MTKWDMIEPHLTSTSLKLQTLKLDVLKDVQHANEDQVGTSWGEEPRLSEAMANLAEAAKTISDCATKLVLVLKVFTIFPLLTRKTTGWSYLTLGPRVLRSLFRSLDP